MTTFSAIAAWLALVQPAAAQSGDPQLQAAFEKLYARIDAAVAAKDRAELNRMIAADGQANIGPLRVGLRAVVAEEMKKAGLTRRSEVKEVTAQGVSTVVTVDVFYTEASGAARKEIRTRYRETWTKGEDGWVCRESERTGGESGVAPTGPVEARAVVAELKARAVKLSGVEPAGSDADLEAFGRAVAPWPESAAADRYIKNEGAPAVNVGFGQDLLEWMRAENRGGARLTWTGFDMQSVGPAADLALEFVRRHAPELAVSSRRPARLQISSLAPWLCCCSPA